MAKVKVTGLFAAAVVVLASASGCAVQAADGEPNASSSDEALVCSEDPISEGLNKGWHHSGNYLTEAWRKDIAPLSPSQKDGEWDTLVVSPLMKCVVNQAKLYCDEVPQKTDASWAPDCYDGRKHWLDFASCKLPPQRLLAILQKNCPKADAEVFEGSLKFPSDGNPDTTWLILDPTGSGPHLNPNGGKGTGGSGNQ